MLEHHRGSMFLYRVYSNFRCIWNLLYANNDLHFFLPSFLAFLKSVLLYLFKQCAEITILCTSEVPS